MKPHAFPARSAAFTLLEMLIGIAVLAALAAMLTGAMQIVSSNAAATRCLGNLRNIATMFQSYLSDHQMSYPFAVMRPSPTSPNRFWPQELVEHSGRSESLKSFICPSIKDVHPDLERGVGGHAYVSYAINRYGVAPAETDGYVPARQTTLQDAAKVLLIVDFDTPGQPYEGWYVATRQGVRNEWQTLRKRHQSVNALFCDGHVEKLNYERDTSGPDTAFPWRSYSNLHRP